MLRRRQRERSGEIECRGNKVMHCPPVSLRMSVSTQSAFCASPRAPTQTPPQILKASHTSHVFNSSSLFTNFQRPRPPHRATCSAERGHSSTTPARSRSCLLCQSIDIAPFRRGHLRNRLVYAALPVVQSPSDARRWHSSRLS